MRTSPGGTTDGTTTVDASQPGNPSTAFYALRGLFGIVGFLLTCGTNGKGTTLSRAVYAPTLSTALAAGGHASSLNPGNAEQYRYSTGFATSFPITGF